MVWVEVNEEMKKQYGTLKGYDGDYVLVEGIFNMNNKGHYGAYAGSLEHITRYDKMYDYYDIHNRDKIEYKSDFGFSLFIPRSWKKRYIIEETDTQLVVSFKPSIDISEESCRLFSIVKKTADLDEALYDTVSEKREFSYNGIIYVIGGPTDFTYPEDGPELSDFNKMQSEIPQVIDGLFDNNEIKLNKVFKDFIKIEKYYNLEDPIGTGTGFAIDKEIALMIGSAILNKEGSDDESNMFLFDVKKEKDYYVVSCTPYPDYNSLGGDRYVSIREKDGKVLRVWGGE